MKKNKKSRLYFYFIAIIIFIGFLYLLFNQGGLIKFIKLTKEISSLNEDIEKLTEENNALKREIDSLRNEIPAKIEKIAREKYDMIKEGEKVIEVKEDENKE